MENGSFVIIYNPKFHSILFFHSGAFHAQGMDIHPVKIYRFYLKFNKNMVSNVITGIMIKKKIIKKQKKRLHFEQILVNFPFNSLPLITFWPMLKR